MRAVAVVVDAVFIGSKVRFSQVLQGIRINLTLKVCMLGVYSGINNRYTDILVTCGHRPSLGQADLMVVPLVRIEFVVGDINPERPYNTVAVYGTDAR